MPPFVFDAPTMATGVDSVDSQHKQLIAMINGLVHALEAGDPGPAVGGALSQLQNYTKTHFAHEERCMMQISCPVARVNELAHATFLRSVDEFAGEFGRTGPTRALAFKLEGSMSSWLKTHIASTDTKMRPCVPAGVRM
ncbi:MAG: hemerythrin family protein [Chloroflexota bacterium]